MRASWIWRGGVIVLLCLLTWRAPAAAQADAAEQRFNAGVTAFKAGKFSVAAREFKASIAERPTANAAIYLGNAYLRLGQLTQARRAFRQALGLNPGAAKAAALEELIKGIEAEDTAIVTITSTPPGADVVVGKSKRRAGQTPLELELATGKQTLRLELATYQSSTTELKLDLDEERAVEIAMVGIPCELALASEAPGATATVDGGAPLTLPTTIKVEVGDHAVRVAAEGFEPHDETVTCVPAGSLSASPTLELARGRVKLPITEGTVVTVNGEEVAIDAEIVAQGLGLPPGTHEVSVTEPGKPTWTKIVEVPSGGEVALEAPPPPPEPAPPPPEPPPPPPPPPPPYARGSMYVGVGG
ncbi:MAG: PEGA domain-containing protein, partial [Kofleriaceae bacterium]